MLLCVDEAAEEVPDEGAVPLAVPDGRVDEPLEDAEALEPPFPVLFEDDVRPPAELDGALTQ